MKPEEQRIAIAVACGYNLSPDHFRVDNIINETWNAPAGFYVGFKELPDYLNDLNAMHEAEKVLTNEVRDTFKGSRLGYEHELRQICGGSGDSIYANAAQKAEAFLRTLNLWQD